MCIELLSQRINLKISNEKIRKVVFASLVYLEENIFESAMI